MKKAEQIQIENVQPIIITGAKPGRPYRYPFDALKVGQTFWLPDARKCHVNIYMAVWRRNRKGTDRQFVLTKGIKDDKSGFRVQRIK